MSTSPAAACSKAICRWCPRLICSARSAACSEHCCRACQRSRYNPRRFALIGRTGGHRIDRAKVAARSATSMSIALVFPGQGSQSVGMLAALTARYASAAQCFEQGSQALGFDLWRLVAGGPAERLNATDYTQPAMLAAGIATWRAWREQGGAAPAVVAGHSLGEFTALVCAQALPFEAALQLVRYRGQIMQHAVPEGTGAMAAILGLEDAEVESACAQAAQGEVVQAVNFNSPAQGVIAGHAAAVERAMALARELGAKRAVLLPVSVPAHSLLMAAAAQQ